MAFWIWRYGDFEIRKSLQMNARREYEGHLYPAFWPCDDCTKNVIFRKKYVSSQPDTVCVTVDGFGVVLLDGKRYQPLERIAVPAGTHVLEVRVTNLYGLPSAYVEGSQVESDDTWEASAADKHFSPVGMWSLVNDKNVPPERFELPGEKIEPRSACSENGGILLDFGREVTIRLCLDGIHKGFEYEIVYGESREEALSEEAIIHETICFDEYSVIRPIRACRFVFIRGPFDHAFALFESLPVSHRGSFSCEDEEINQIYNTSQYTYDITAREFFVDGVKRDRWVWSGDAFQSYFMDFYCSFDPWIIKRTILALRGRNEVSCHINTIVDYSFYWLVSIAEYYRYFGDTEFVKRIYPQMKSLYAFCEKHVEDGLYFPADGDWVFVDWSDMEKQGAMCAIEILRYAALKSLTKIASLVNDEKDSGYYLTLATELHQKIIATYWDENRGAFITNVTKAHRSNEVRRHANIFAVLFGIADEKMTHKIVQNVIENPEIPPITTPYFKLYELELMCRLGQKKQALEEIRSYWGGMLHLGATTFWEQYNPSEKGEQHFAMYGDRFGKSLCHAWGASPLYLLGRYFLGVTPGEDGYSSFVCEPYLGFASLMEGDVPTPQGTIHVRVDRDWVKVDSDHTPGIVIIQGMKYPLKKAEHGYSIIVSKK